MTDELFDPDLLEFLAASALCYRRDTAGDGALRFALIVAGLMFSEHAKTPESDIQQGFSN